MRHLYFDISSSGFEFYMKFISYIVRNCLTGIVRIFSEGIQLEDLNVD